MQQVTLVPSVQFATPSPSPAPQAEVETSDHGHTKKTYHFHTVFRKMPSWPHAKVVQFSTIEDAETRKEAFPDGEYWHGDISRHYENNEIFDAYKALTHNVCIETMSIHDNGLEKPVWKVTEVDFMFASHQGYAPLSSPDLVVKSVQYFDKDGRCDVKGNAVEFSVQFKVEDVRTSTRLDGGLRSSNFELKTNEKKYPKQSLRAILPEEVLPEEVLPEEVLPEKVFKQKYEEVNPNELSAWCLLNSSAYVQFFDESRKILIETRMEHIADSMDEIKNLFSEVLTQFEKKTINEQGKGVNIENLCFDTFYSHSLPYGEIDFEFGETTRVKDERGAIKATMDNEDDREEMRERSLRLRSADNKVSNLLQTLCNETQILGTWYYYVFGAQNFRMDKEYFEDVDGVSYIQADLYFLVQRYCILHQFSILKAYCFDKEFWDDMFDANVFGKTFNEESKDSLEVLKKCFKSYHGRLPSGKKNLSFEVALSATLLCVVALNNLNRRHESTLIGTLNKLKEQEYSRLPHGSQLAEMEYWFEGTGAHKSREVAWKAFELLELYARSQCANRKAARVWEGSTLQQNTDTSGKSQRNTKGREKLHRELVKRIGNMLKNKDESNVAEQKKVYSECRTFFREHTDLELTYYSLFAADATNVPEESEGESYKEIQRNIEELRDKAEEKEMGDV